MEEDSKGSDLSNVIRIDDERVRDHLGRIVRGTVEETLNAMLEAEADRLCNAGRYERTEARRDQRSGSYDRKLQTRAHSIYFESGRDSLLAGGVIQAEGWAQGGQLDMAAPLSLDIRKRIVAAVEGGASRRAAADRFAVSESTAIKLVQQWEQTGSLQPGRMGGYRPFALAAHEKLVRELMAQAPDQTLDELRDRLADRGVMVGRTSVHRYLSALGLTRKKRHSMPPNKTVRTSRPPGRRGVKIRQG